MKTMHLASACAQVKASNGGLTAAPQAFLACPNDQYGPGKTCEDFGDTLQMSADGKTVLTSGGFTDNPDSFSTYVYQTQGCVKNTGRTGGPSA